MGSGMTSKPPIPSWSIYPVRRRRPRARRSSRRAHRRRPGPRACRSPSPMSARVPLNDVVEGDETEYRRRATNRDDIREPRCTGRTAVLGRGEQHERASDELRGQVVRASLDRLGSLQHHARPRFLELQTEQHIGIGERARHDDDAMRPGFVWRSGQWRGGERCFGYNVALSMIPPNIQSTSRYSHEGFWAIPCASSYSTTSSRGLL